MNKLQARHRLNQRLHRDVIIVVFSSSKAFFKTLKHLHRDNFVHRIQIVGFNYNLPLAVMVIWLFVLKDKPTCLSAAFDHIFTWVDNRVGDRVVTKA